MARRPVPRYEGRELIENVGVVRSGNRGAGLMAAAGSLRSFAAELGQEAQARNIAKARERGENAVTMDETGQIQVEPLPEPDSPANRAFLSAAEQGYIAAFTNAHQSAAARLQVDHPFDSPGFAASWQGHSKGALLEVPKQFKGRAERILGDLGQRHADHLLLRTAEKDRANAKSEWTAHLGSLEDQLAALAKAGQTGDPAYEELVIRYQAALEGGVSAMFLNEEAAKARREATADEGEALALSKTALDAYVAAGRGTAGMKAADDHLQRIVGDPALKLSEARRERIANLAQERIREAESIRRLEVADLRAEADDALTKLELGYPVDKTALFGLAQRANEAGEHEFGNRLRAAYQNQQTLASFGRKPLSEQQAEIRRRDATLMDGGGTGDDARLVRDMERAHASKAVALREDAFTYGQRVHKDLVGEVPPLDWSKPDEVAESLAKRVATAARISEIEGVPVLPYSKVEGANLAGAIAASNATQKAVLAGTLADGLGARHLPVVLNDLIARDADSRLFAIGAGTAQDDVGLARRIFNGADVIKANKEVLPEANTTVLSVINKEIGDSLMARPEMRGALVEAAWSLYAEAANAKGDFTGRFDTGRLRDSIEQVTGGIVEHNGGKLIPPVRGMSEDQFEDLMDSLKDIHLSSVPLKAVDGSRVTAKMIRNHAQLISVADGLYEVRIKGFAIPHPVDPGKTYLLDLRRGRPGED